MVFKGGFLLTWSIPATMVALLVSPAEAWGAGPVTGCRQTPEIEVTAHDVSAASPDASLPVELEVLCHDTGVAGRVSYLDLSLLYDPEELLLDSISGGDFSSICHWFVGFTMSPVTVDSQQKTLLRLVSEDTEGVPCLADGTPSFTLWFTAADSGKPTNGFTTLDFFWDTCTCNFMWLNRGDTALVASQVVDADGFDITDENDTLPGFSGPSRYCLDPVAYNGASVSRSIRFKSGKITFKSPTDVADGSQVSPPTVQLLQNYPNPFNPTTNIEFSLSCRSTWCLEITNVQGQLVRCYRGEARPGTVTIQWDGRNRNGHPVASGIYFCHLTAGKHQLTQKMMLVR